MAKSVYTVYSNKMHSNNCSSWNIWRKSLASQRFLQRSFCYFLFIFWISGVFMCFFFCCQVLRGQRHHSLLGDALALPVLQRLAPRGAALAAQWLSTRAKRHTATWQNFHHHKDLLFLFFFGCSQTLYLVIDIEFDFYGQTMCGHICHWGCHWDLQLRLQKCRSRHPSSDPESRLRGLRDGNTADITSLCCMTVWQS